MGDGGDQRATRSTVLPHADRAPPFTPTSFGSSSGSKERQRGCKERQCGLWKGPADNQRLQKTYRGTAGENDRTPFAERTAQGPGGQAGCGRK